MTRIMIQVSPAEVIDRYLILKLKAARILDPAKRQQAHKAMLEFSLLRDSVVDHSEALEILEDRLWKCHLTIWDAEDKIRWYDRNHDYCINFTVNARLIAKTNDERASLKQQIDLLLGATPGDVKEYACG